jgi:hypothetical protein
MSGISYKKEIRKGIGKIEKEVRRIKFKCLVQGCHLDAINSHSQQKENQLRSIAQQGQVYRLENNMYQATGKKSKDMKLWGISEASIFRGFCNDHDEFMFRPLERKSLNVDDSQQAFLLFLRAVCYEFCQKRKSYEYLTRFCRLLERLDSPAYEEAIVMKEGVKDFIELDSVRYFTQLWNAFEKDNYDVLDTAWFKIEKNVGASSACIFSPFLDEYYESIHTQLAYAGPPILSFNLIPSNKETHVISSWFIEDAKYCKWVHELLGSENGVEKYINLGAIAQSEDTCFSPSLWNSTSIGLKNRAFYAMEHDLWRGKLEEIPIVIPI